MINSHVSAIPRATDHFFVNLSLEKLLYFKLLVIIRVNSLPSFYSRAGLYYTGIQSPKITGIARVIIMYDCCVVLLPSSG